MIRDKLYVLKDLLGNYSISDSNANDASVTIVDEIESSIYEKATQIPNSYKVENDKFTLLMSVEELDKEIIRKRRELECFPIINRGELWRKSLTDEQSTELESWYHQWLDAPETMIVPEKPLWLQI